MQTGGTALLFNFHGFTCHSILLLSPKDEDYDIVPYFDNHTKTCFMYENGVEFTLNCMASPSKDSQKECVNAKIKVNYLLSNIFFVRSPDYSSYPSIWYFSDF